MSKPEPIFTAGDASRIIEMAWEDRTPFEAIALQFGYNESQVVALMRRSMKLTMMIDTRSTIATSATSRPSCAGGSPRAASRSRSRASVGRRRRSPARRSSTARLPGWTARPPRWSMPVIISSSWASSWPWTTPTPTASPHRCCSSAANWVASSGRHDTPRSARRLHRCGRNSRVRGDRPG